MVSPKVSIVVPVYNVEKYIERCARSLFEQTMADLEFVFVDDCSPDKSMDILHLVLQDYPHRQSQVTIVRHEVNKNLAVSRKDSAYAATGEFLMFVDSDDFLELDAAELLYNKAIAEGADLVTCGAFHYSADRVNIINPANNEMGEFGANVREDSLNRNVFTSVWAKLVRREVMMKEGVVWPVRGFSEDVIVSAMMVYYSNRIVSIEDNLYHYCYNETSFMGDVSLAKMESNCRDSMENYKVFAEFFEKENLEEQYPMALLRYKVGIKARLAILANNRQRRMEYRTTFPEIDKHYFWGSDGYRPSLKERFRIAAWWLGLMPRFHRIIDSRHVRPTNAPLCLFMKCSYK